MGGVWGYADFLEAIADPENEQHEELREWIGGKFDPEAFDPVEATRRMKRGLPDWRDLAMSGSCCLAEGACADHRGTAPS